MTDRTPKPPAGMAEVSAKFVHEAEAPARNIQDIINEALGKIPPYSVDETDIAYIYRKLLAIRAGRPPDLSSDDIAAWIDEHDGMEATIGRTEARNTQDVDIKLAVLCDRLRENEASELLMAQTVRDDLKKLLATPSPTTPQDTRLETLLDDWYAAHKVFAAAAITNDRAREKDPEKRAAMERAEQRTDALYEQIVDTPAQGLHGIHAKMRAAVFPDQWEAVRAGKLDNLGAEINAKMFFSLVADVERLAGKKFATAPIPATETDVTDLVALRDKWREALNALCDATEAEEAAEGPERELLKEKEDAADARECEAWKAFLEVPCRTMTEVLFKLHIVHEKLKEHAFALRTEDLFNRAMQDFERLGGEAALIAEEHKPAAVEAASAPLIRAKPSDLERVVSNLEGASNALNNVVQSDDLPTEVDIGLQWLAYQIDAGMVDLRDECDKLHVAVEQAPIAGDTGT